MLERLAGIRDRLEILQPKRAVYEETARRMAAQEAAMQGEKKALAESQRRLQELDKDAAMREELLPKEEEHTKLQAQLLALEGLRDKHSEMQARQKEEAVREQAIVANLSRTKKLIDDLCIARARCRGDCITARRKKRGARASWQSLSGKESCKRSWKDCWRRKSVHGRAPGQAEERGGGSARRDGGPSGASRRRRHSCAARIRIWISWAAS